MKLTIALPGSKAASFFNALPAQLVDLTAAGAVLLLAVGGGVQYFITPTFGLAVTGLMLGLVVLGILAGFDIDEDNPLSDEWVILFFVMIVSAMVNGASWAALGRVGLFFVAGSALMVGRVYAQTIRRGLIIAAVAWPAVWLLANAAGYGDNRNISAAFTVIFVLALLTTRHKALWGAILANCVLIGWLGSRGAVLGLLAGLLVYLWPYLRSGRAVVLLLPAVLAVMWWLRPTTAMYRLGYWQDALNAWRSSPLFGVGPGGLWVTQAIAEPGGGWQLHAHNMAVTWVATTGLVGLIFGALAVWNVWQRRHYFPRPVWAIWAAMAAHGMVDDPLWWPGVLVLVTLLSNVDTFCRHFSSRNALQ